MVNVLNESEPIQRHTQSPNRGKKTHMINVSGCQQKVDGRGEPWVMMECCVLKPICFHLIINSVLSVFWLLLSSAVSTADDTMTHTVILDRGNASAAKVCLLLHPYSNTFNKPLPIRRHFGLTVHHWTVTSVHTMTALSICELCPFVWCGVLHRQNRAF